MPKANLPPIGLKDGSIRSLTTAPVGIDWDRVDAVIRGRFPEPVPPGWFTIDDYAKQHGISYQAAKARLRCVSFEIVEKRCFPIKTSGGIQDKVHYRIKDVA